MRGITDQQYKNYHKRHFKQRIDKTRQHYLDIQDLIVEKDAYDKLKLSLKTARQSLTLEIYLHNFNLREAINTLEKYKKNCNEMLDSMMYSDDEWGVGIVDLASEEKTEDDYIGGENSKTEDLRRFSENIMYNIRQFDKDIINLTNFLSDEF